MRLLRLFYLTCFFSSAVVFAKTATAAGEPVVVNPNGGWSWFGDERAVVDTKRNVLYVGSLGQPQWPRW